MKKFRTEDTNRQLTRVAGDFDTLLSMMDGTII